jgi:hypothetical protein
MCCYWEPSRNKTYVPITTQFERQHRIYTTDGGTLPDRERSWWRRELAYIRGRRFRGPSGSHSVSTLINAFSRRGPDRAFAGMVHHRLAAWLTQICARHRGPKPVHLPRTHTPDRHLERAERSYSNAIIIPQRDITNGHTKLNEPDAIRGSHCRDLKQK